MRLSRHPLNRRQAALAMALVVVVGTAHAAEEEYEAPRTGWRPFIVGGLTHGGETLFVMSFSTGESVRVESGDFVQVGIGAHWRSTSGPFSAAISANIHNENSPAVDGYTDFSRYPVEAILYYHAAENWRFGLGARRAFSPKLDIRKTSAPTFHRKYSFDDATGAIGEVGYSATQNLWINFRYVREEYKPKLFTDVEAGSSMDISGFDAVDGSHFGINLLYVF